MKPHKQAAKTALAAIGVLHYGRCLRVDKCLNKIVNLFSLTLNLHEFFCKSIYICNTSPCYLVLYVQIVIVEVQNYYCGASYW